MAEHHLAAAGLEIIERKRRVPSGEIDLIARDGDDIVCIEVRTRSAVPGLAAESITPQKLARMWASAFEYAETTGIDEERLRVDLVSVELEAGGKLREILHIRGLDAPGEV